MNLKSKWKKVLFEGENVVFTKSNYRLLTIKIRKIHLFLSWVCRIALFNSTLYAKICSFTYFNSALRNYFGHSIALFNSALFSFAFIFFKKTRHLKAIIFREHLNLSNLERITKKVLIAEIEKIRMREKKYFF